MSYLAAARGLVVAARRQIWDPKSSRKPPENRQKTARNGVIIWVGVSGGFLAVFWRFFDGFLMVWDARLTLVYRKAGN